MNGCKLLHILLTSFLLARYNPQIKIRRSPSFRTSWGLESSQAQRREQSLELEVKFVSCTRA